MKIVCIGSTSKDIFLPTGEGVITETPEDLMSQRKISFELGAKYHINNRYESLGGCAANVASGLASLGVPAACYTTIGSDMLGQWIKKEFEKKKISTILSSTEEEIPQSDLSAIVVDEKSGERIIFTNQEANEKLRVDPENLEGYDWIFIGDLNNGWEENLDRILELSSKNKIRLAFNPRQKTIHDNVGKIIETAKQCEVLLVNKDEAIEIVSGLEKDAKKEELNDEAFLVKTLQGMGSKIAAVTDGIRGAWASDGKNIFYSKATGDNPVDTTGAGDAFSSGFLAAVIREKNLEEALKWGIINSGSSVKFYGAHEGLLGEQEILKHAENIKIESL